GLLAGGAARASLAPGRTSPTGTRYGPGVLRTRGAASGKAKWTQSTKHKAQHRGLAHRGEQPMGPSRQPSVLNRGTTGLWGLPRDGLGVRPLP
ncbi:MAG: hypothetical protein ACI8WY_003552, partial [Planctomycetota bacterium]